MSGNSRQSFTFPVSGMLGGGISLQMSVLYRFNRGVRLMKVSFKVNNGNKFWDFGYCPLRGCPLRGSPLNTVSA